MTAHTTPSVPADCVSAYDYERYARQLLPADVWAYIAGWGADGITQRANRHAFDSQNLCGRVLTDMRHATTARQLFGRTLAFPIILAPVAFQKLAHSDGELATVLGASAVSAWMTVSTQSSVTLEDVAKAANTTLWFQLYMQAARDDTTALVRRAEQAGYAAIVVTVDAAVNGVRNVEQRAGFRLPVNIRAANLDGISPAPAPRVNPGESPVFKGLLDAAPTWSDLEWLRKTTTLPIILKGVLHPDDADRAIAMGIDGLVVSNHGGRVLDTLPSSLDALAVVARRVDRRVPIFFDGGIRRGTDILKAIALGARAVMIGQPIMHALAVAGPVGIIHLLTILHAELEAAMALTGCTNLDAIDDGVLWPPK